MGIVGHGNEHMGASHRQAGLVWVIGKTRVPMVDRRVHRSDELDRGTIARNHEKLGPLGIEPEQVHPAGRRRQPPNPLRQTVDDDEGTLASAVTPPQANGTIRLPTGQKPHRGVVDRHTPRHQGLPSLGRREVLTSPTLGIDGP